MSRPIQDVRVWDIQDRRNRANATRPWVVRWTIDGREKSRSHRTKAEATTLHSGLLVALRAGERFDPETGEPESWAPVADGVQVHAWVRRWLAEQWPEWQPRTRSSAVEALARFVPLARQPRAPEPPEDLGRYLKTALRPDVDVDASDPMERWLSRWSVALARLDRAYLAGVERQLVLRLDGGALSSAAAGRYRKIAHACIRRAVELDVLPSDPWPPAPKGRSRRKVVRARKPMDVRRLPDPATMARVIAALRTHQPGSRIYQAMTSVSYYGGLRPSEVVMLRPQALELPAVGWGRINVVEADVDYDEPGEPKEGHRSVPIPPQLVTTLSGWVEERTLGPGDLLFRTRNDKRPAPSNWSRSLHRALRTVGHPPIRVYDCRHAAATTWLGAGVPLGEVARRLGHSVETLVSTYVGALEGDETLANERIEAALATKSPKADAATAEAATSS